MYAQGFFLIGEVTGKQPQLQIPSVLRCVFYAHGLKGPHFLHISRVLFPTTKMSHYLTGNNYNANSNVYFREVENSVAIIIKSAEQLQV